VITRTASAVENPLQIIDFFLVWNLIFFKPTFLPIQAFNFWPEGRAFKILAIRGGTAYCDLFGTLLGKIITLVNKSKKNMN
jgi:hypothetical protein